jgi:hypothetical protein
MVFSKLNELINVLNEMANIGMEEKVEVMRPITQEDIHQTFADYNEFVSRPDHGILMGAWYLGIPLNDLPPAPTPEAKMMEERAAKAAPSEPEASEPEEEEYPEGAVIFGGDYGDNDGDEGEETPTEAPGEVSEVSEDTGEEDEPADEEDGEPVPAVP